MKYNRREKPDAKNLRAPNMVNTKLQLKKEERKKIGELKKKFLEDN